MEKEVKMYFKGGKGILKPIDFNGNEIKEGDVLTNDSFDDFFNDDFYTVHYPNWTKKDIEDRKNRPFYTVHYNEKGFFFGIGIEQEFYLHDFRFKYTKIIK